MTKIAFISDIHSNLDALQAVLGHIDESGADMTLCLGDIVGYGPCPAECVKLIREREIPCVMGNHDEYVTLLMDPRVERLREEIRKAVEWTQSQLSMDDLFWLSKLPMAMQADEFAILHSSFAPGNWAYCLDERTFRLNFEYQQVPLAFCGHSHSPLVGYENPGSDPEVNYIRPVVLPTDRKIMVNVGSVGQPRDRNPRACVVFYEIETRKLWMDRVDYDIEAAQARFDALGDGVLSTHFKERIRFGK